MIISRKGRMLEIQGNRLHLKLNCLRGLALDMLIDREVSAIPLCGTIHHGHFDDIGWGSDFYSGHLVLERPGQAKVTDLNAVEPVITEDAGGRVFVFARVQTIVGAIDKEWCIDDVSGSIHLRYHLNWQEDAFLGSLRLGHLTLIPGAFEKSTMSYITHNGGTAEEQFSLEGHRFNHGSPVSFLVSASHALSMTECKIRLGDHRKELCVELDKNQAALIGLVTHNEIKKSSFTRLAFSAREIDDTSHSTCVGSLDFKLKISASKVLKECN